MTDLTDELKAYALELGADTVGVTAAEDMMGAPEGHRPTDYLSEAASVVVWATKLIDGVVDRMPESRKEFTANNFEVDAINQDITFRTAKFLEKAGHTSYPISYFRREYKAMALYDLVKLFGAISVKHAAEAAGLGRIGRHSLLITPQFGPRHRMSAVITDAPLRPSKPLPAKLCDPETCGYACAEVCPAGAIPKDGQDDRVFDKYRCSEYGIRVLESYRCSMCMSVCPQAVWGAAMSTE
jgi:epoxyqueuosine reductase QueG